MKLGIKVGLKGDPIADLNATHPDFCEVWFHSGKIADYTGLLSYIQKKQITIGLHFWGQLEDTTLANIAYPDAKILKTSRDLVKKTIDTAASFKAWYVNLHPGSRQLARVDFEAEQLDIYTQPADLSLAEEVLHESLSQLTQYAQERNVELLVESVPARTLNHPWLGTEGRKKPLNMSEILISSVEKCLTISNLYFTNDFGHTAANAVTSKRGDIWKLLYDVSKRLVPKTKLLHVGYIIPPFNGTDYHGLLYNPEFKTKAAIPNYQGTLELLGLYKQTTDIGALAEPSGDHPGNFKVLKKLLSEIP